MKAYITGIGGISAIGINVNEITDKLLKSETGIAPINFLETRYKNEYVAGEVKLTNEQLLKYAKVEDDKITRTTLLGIIAVEEAMRNASCLNENNKNTAFISSTTVAGMVRTENYFKDFIEGTNHVNFIDSHNSGYHSEIIADMFGLKGHIATINTACSSSANAIILGARLINSGLYDRVIAGGTDALCKYTLNGFNSLMLLDKQLCKPFDKNRKGINLGEGAAYVVLESEVSIKKLKKNILGCISGYGMANDAFHQTSISTEAIGICIAMEAALKRAKLNHTAIDYINAHGTATNNNDLTEGIALKKVFNAEVPFFSSTKSFTGHLLAAAGALEVIISLLSMRHQSVFANLNFSNSIEEHGLIPASKLIENVRIKNVLSNSIGIGGFCSSLIISDN